MSDAVPILLVPGLACSPRLFVPQLSGLWQFGPVTIADTRRGSSMGEIAGRILGVAPPVFALAGLSMGGYIAFEIMRLAPERVRRLALLDTAARADRPEQTERRNVQIAMARDGRFAEIPDLLFPAMVHADHQQDAGLRQTFGQMCHETGADAFIQQQEAIKARPELQARAGRDKLPYARAGRRRRSGDATRCLARDCRRNSREPAGDRAGLRASLHLGAARCRHARADGMDGVLALIRSGGHYPSGGFTALFCCVSSFSAAMRRQPRATRLRTALPEGVSATPTR